MRPIGKKAIPDLQTGPARSSSRAKRPVLYGSAPGGIDRDPRRAGAAASRRGRRALDVPLRQPRRQRVRRLPRDAGGRRRRACASATRSIRGYPAKRRRHHRRPGDACRVLRAALQSGPPTRRSRCSRATWPATRPSSPLDHMVFPKVYQKSRIEIDDQFIGRVVPAIAANSPDEKIATDDLLPGS